MMPGRWLLGRLVAIALCGAAVVGTRKLAAAAPPVSSPRLLAVRATLLDPRSGRTIPRGVVLIGGDRIVDVGAVGAATSPTVPTATSSTSPPNRRPTARSKAPPTP